MMRPTSQDSLLIHSVCVHEVKIMESKVVCLFEYKQLITVTSAASDHYPPQIHPSIFYTRLIRRSGHRARGGVHPGQVASPSQGPTEIPDSCFNGWG